MGGGFGGAGSRHRGLVICCKADPCSEPEVPYPVPVKRRMSIPRTM